MATETLDRREGHIRGLTVTTIATVLGIGAGVGAAALASGAKDMIGVYVLLAAVAVQFPLLRLVGIDVGDFSPKDYLYVVFMTFALWFVTWTIFLSTGTQF